MKRLDRKTTACTLLAFLMLAPCTLFGFEKAVSGANSALMFASDAVTGAGPAADSGSTPHGPAYVSVWKRPTSVEVVAKQLVRSMIDWNRGKSQTAEGVDRWWNNTKAVKLGCNLINVFPVAKTPDTKSSIGDGRSVLIPAYGDFIMKYTAAGLKEAHDNGIQVMTSLPMTLIDASTYQGAGLTLSDYCSIYPNGSRYNGGCHNNPNFRKLIHDYVMLSAKAGYDGMFCDANPYSYGPDYNCSCNYCKEAWAKRSLEVLGHKADLLTKTPNHLDAESRAFYEWRANVYLQFMLLLRDDAKKINPNFEMWPNTGMNSTLPIYYLLGGLDTIISEYGSTDLLQSGEESTMYLFRVFEAVCKDKMLISQFNSSDQYKNEAASEQHYRFYTAYAEALASGGSLMLPISSADDKRRSVVEKYNTIIDNNAEAFTGSASIADTAVAYSWTDITTSHLNSSGAITFSANTSRRAASLLTSAGIPYDYIVPEKGLTAAELKRYKTIIIPELYTAENEFLDLLEQYVKDGGQLLILGQRFATGHFSDDYEIETFDYDMFEKWTGTKYASAKAGSTYVCGEGRMAVCRSYASGFDDESRYKARPELLETFETLGMYDLIRVEGKTNGKVETSIRANANLRRIWVHLINYATEGKKITEGYTATIDIPEGKAVVDVTPSCAFQSSQQMNFSWKVLDGKLKVRGIFDIHTMLTIKTK